LIEGTQFSKLIFIVQMPNHSNIGGNQTEKITAADLLFSEILNDHESAEAEEKSGITQTACPDHSTELRRAAHEFKPSPDQGNADGQWRYGACLWNTQVISKDLSGADHSSRLSADQGNADGQWSSGVCLCNGNGISQDYKRAVHYFKLSADQGNKEVKGYMVNVWGWKQRFLTI
jgi:TPR repeat protein